MADEAIIEDVGISGEESQLIALHEDGEAQESEEAEEGYRTSTIVDEIMKDGVNNYLGRLLDERSAAEAYDQAAQEMFGEFAQTNLTYEDRKEGTRPSLVKSPRSHPPYPLAS